MAAGPMHWVRFGSLGDVAGFASADGARYARGVRVVLETSRGLEVGEVLQAAEHAPSETEAAGEAPDAEPAANADHDDSGAEPDSEAPQDEFLSPPRSAAGVVLRALTANDEFVLARQEKNRHAAFERCSARVAELRLPVMLVDVELLFDGQGLYFYFLGEADPRLDDLTSELAEEFETAVRFRQFTETVDKGCGPSCGTAEGSGCGSCAEGGCAIAGACSTKGKAKAASAAER